MHSGSVPMMTTASIVRWPSRRHQACRVEGEKLETRNLRRGWAGSSASLSSPARKIVENDNDRLDRCSLGCTLSVSHHPPSLGRLPPADGQVARRLPGRHSSVTASPLRCRTGLSVGRRGTGRPLPWCPQVVFLPASTCWTRTSRRRWPCSR